MTIPLVLTHVKFDYGYVTVVQNHERESDLLPLGDPDKLIPMGSKSWRGSFSTLLPLSIGDKVEINDYLPGIMGDAFINKVMDGQYLFEGSGALEIGN